jgi:16S rRNA processing protein RimM
MSSPSSKKTNADAGPARVQVGRLIRAHGVKGEALVEILTDRPDERFTPGAVLFLADAQGHAKKPDRLTIETTRPYRDALLVLFREITAPEVMTTLRGGFLEVPASVVPPPPDGSYYHFQLVGCRCLDATVGELGQVRDVVEDGGGLLIVVEREGVTLPIPFVQAFLEAVDLEAREIRFRLPPGLVETCASKS